MKNVVDLIFIGILIVIIFIMIYSMKELFKYKKRVEIQLDGLKNNLNYEIRRLEENIKILLQKIECRKCFCKRMPYINFEEIEKVVGLSPFVCKKMNIDCKFCHQDLTTELCLAKDKKYIEDRLKEHQSDERELVLGENDYEKN